MLGCMAQKDQDHIFRRAGHIDLVVGPGQFNRLPQILEEVAAQRFREPRLEVSLDRLKAGRSQVEESFAHFDPPRPPELRASPFQAMVRIMFGCDKFCTYCIVPKVRGPEQSRPAAEIVEEVRRLAADGCLEVTLLGQTVNSYKDTSDGKHLRLSDLIARLNAIDGLRRIKFVTNYPKHMTDDLLQAVRDLPKVSPYLHVPVQSGSNEQLKRMKRGYTVEYYREMIERIRATVPDAAITSDFIVGFCGETEEDFQQTVEIVRMGPLQEQFHIQVQRAAGHESGRPHARRRARRGQAAAEQRVAGGAERYQPGIVPAAGWGKCGGVGRRSQQERRSGRPLPETRRATTLCSLSAARRTTTSSSLTARERSSAKSCRCESKRLMRSRCLGGLWKHTHRKAERERGMYDRDQRHHPRKNNRIGRGFGVPRWRSSKRNSPISTASERGNSSVGGRLGGRRRRNGRMV